MNQASDYHWLALKYVTGEMAGEDLASFESLLAESQPAREAVAAAVLLSQAVALAAGGSPPVEIDKPAPSGHGRRTVSLRQRLSWAIAGAAVSLLVAWGLQAWRSASQGDAAARSRPAAQSELADLAGQWSAAADLGLPDSYTADGKPDSEDVAADDRGSLAAGRDAAEELAAPDWLLAAVAAIPPMPMEHEPRQQ